MSRNSTEGFGCLFIVCLAGEKGIKEDHFGPECLFPGQVHSAPDLTGENDMKISLSPDLVPNLSASSSCLVKSPGAW